MLQILIMIAKIFEEITRRIWTDIHLSNKYKIMYGEETITDSILLELAKQNHHGIQILQTNKLSESTNGTDWEWFVGSDTFGWMRYAIQAKKLKCSTGRYESLNHKVGTQPHDDYQLNILKRFSEANDAIALYNFYNYYPQANESSHWHCETAFDKELLGWTFTMLSNVETALNTKGCRTFNAIHMAGALPIRCLFTCPQFKSLYYENAKAGLIVTPFNKPYGKIPKLPQQFAAALKTGILEEFPKELYSAKIEIYPRRIAIIELSLND